jgi:acetolactate synthase-1/2/3 large subunit
MSSAALMEAQSAYVPVVAISGQVPVDLIGRGRGYLHELRDQRAAFEPIVKWTGTARDTASIPELVAEAWREAQAPPSGPVLLEIPVDVAMERASAPLIDSLDGEPSPAPLPGAEELEEAAKLLNEAKRPALWAGGGVLRSGAWAELRALAERWQAPVATTYMGKGSFPEDHELAVGSGCDERAFQQLLEGADVLLCVGTELGAETTGHYSLRLSARLVHVDAAAERIGSSYPAVGLVGDARPILSALGERIRPRERDGRAAERAAAVRTRIEGGLAEQGHGLERGLLEAVRRAVPREAVHAWDMTILAYWAAAHFPALEPRRFLYPLGSGTLGYAWPAALGAALATPGAPTLAVVGDGGILYGVQELATARQYGLDATLLLIDDGGYGVLRKHQRDRYGETFAVDLVQPDFPALVRAFGVPVASTTPEDVGDALTRALSTGGPAVVHLPAQLGLWRPTD